MYTGYETFNMREEYKEANVPELDLHELAHEISKSLRRA